MTQHNGLPTGFFEFFEDLDQDNTREFWTANRKRWERDVRQPMHALVTELSERFEPLRMFRPHRDLRFAKDAAPTRPGPERPAPAIPPAASATTSKPHPPAWSLAMGPCA